MPPRPPACCKAVRLQLFTPSDSIWVSDEVLSHAFQRFCSISWTSRRYGSFVPGPMESRRRLGKRRMTHVSEAVPSAVPNAPSIWGSFWEVDRTQWQWQAPTPRPATQDNSAAALPAWLLDWDTTPQGQTAEPAGPEITHERSLEESVTVEGDLRQFRTRDVREFRETFKATPNRSAIEKMSADFCLQFRKSLSLGLVTQGALDYALKHLSKDFRAAHTEEKIASDLLWRFYTGVWDGIAECKVLGPADIDANIMNRLFSGVVSLPLTEGTQVLAQKILHMVTDLQLRHMEQALTILVKKWTQIWFELQKPGDCLKELQFAETLVAEAEKNVTDAKRLTMALEDGSDGQALSKAQKAIADADAAVTIAIDATTKVQDIWWPTRASVTALARTLEKLPADMLLKLLPIWSEQLVKACTENRMSNLQFAFLWLSAVARLPNVGYDLFVQTWHQVDPAKRLHLNKCSQVILEHWISQGKVTKAAAVRNDFDAFAAERTLHGGSENFTRLLLALDKHRQICFGRTKDLFDLLRKLERPRYISEILFRMKKLGMKVPTTLLGATVKKMGPEPEMVQQALAIWNLPHKMKLGYPLRPDFVPNFVISLINAPGVPPGVIWKLLSIPMYEQKDITKFQRHQAKPLPREMIDLLHKMATAFARSEARPPRVAFRNILQCMYHLQIHNAPISPELTRAVNHECITESMLRGLYVGQKRLRYALYLVAQVEGEDVARKVDETVLKWRRIHYKKWKGEQRTRNVRVIEASHPVGPIQ